MLGVDCLVPYYTEDKARSENWTEVLNYLEQIGLDPVSIVPAAASSPGGARNLLAKLGDDQVIYFNDADSLVPYPQIAEACELAAAEPGLVFAFTHYIRLNEAREPYAYIANSASSGAIAISRICFELLGGYDERFQGWGYEDLDFARRCAARWPVRRVEGELRHLWHPPAGGRREEERDLPVTHEQQKNLQLYESLGRLG